MLGESPGSPTMLGLEGKSLEGARWPILSIYPGFDHRPWSVSVS